MCFLFCFKGTGSKESEDSRRRGYSSGHRWPVSNGTSHTRLRREGDRESGGVEGEVIFLLMKSALCPWTLTPVYSTVSAPIGVLSINQLDLVQLLSPQQSPKTTEGMLPKKEVLYCGDVEIWGWLNSSQLEPTQAKWVAERYPTLSKLWTWLELAWVGRNVWPGLQGQG